MLDDRYIPNGPMAGSNGVVNGGYVAAAAAADTSALAANPVVSAKTVQAASGDAAFNLELDAQAAAAPASYISGWTAAATLLSEAIRDPITVNIEVGYTEYPGDNSPIGSQLAFGGVADSTTDSYSQVRNFLSATGASDVVNAVAALPNASSLNGQSDFSVASAEEKIFGQISASAAAIDGYAGFGTGWDGSIIGAALHEFTHAMGRLDGNSVLSLFRYTSSGTHYFGSDTPAPATYFSVDGGKTVLADFGEASDPSDFLNNSLAVNDPFDEFAGGNSLTALDRTMLDMLGFGGSGPVTTGATNLAIGAATTGSIDNVGDKHTYEVTLTAGTRYAFNLDGYDISSSYTLRDPYLQLLDSSGNLLAADDDISSRNFSSEIDYSAPTGGTYYLVAESSPSDGTYTTGTYQIRSSTPAALAIGATATGVVDYIGDRHAYQVTLTAGTRYAFNLDGYDTASSYTLRDPYLQLLDSNGNVLAADDDISSSNWSSEIDYTAAAGGTYYLEAESSPSDSSYTIGSYQIRSSTPTALTIGTAATGEISYAGDRHAYQVTLTAGTHYVFNLDGSDTASSFTLRDPYLQLLDSNGNLLAADDDISSSNWSSEIDYTAAASGTYYLEAESSPSDSSYTIGTYQVRSSATSAASPVTILAGAQADPSSSSGVAIIPVGNGDQALAADPKPEIFDFSSVGFGNDTITGFDPTRDALRLGSSLAGNFAAVAADMSATAAGTLIDLDKAHSIILNGVSPGSLSAANFAFT